MDELTKKQIELCLGCKVAHDVIRDYDEIYEDLFGESTPISKKELDGHVRRLADILHIQGTLEQKKSSLKLLSNFEELDIDESEVTDKKTCRTVLEHILTFLSPFLSKVQITDIPDRKPYAKIIYSKMNEVNMQYKDNCDGDAVKEIVRNLYDKKYREKNTEKIIDILENMYWDYKDVDITEAKCHCNYKGDAFLSIAEKAAHAKQENQKEFETLSGRVAELGSGLQAIVWEYIRHAPKRFGDVLGIIMNLQGMNETDVAQLLDVPPNRIQAFRQNVEPPEDRSMVTLLSRALLVSEDVLSCGFGKIYGNWSGLFEKEEIRQIKNSTGLNLANTTEAKKWLIQKIREIMKMEQAEFDGFLEENSPDFFCIREIDIFEIWKSDYEEIMDNESGEMIYHGEVDISETRKSAYEELLDKKAVYTLLEVFERLDRKQE